MKIQPKLKQVIINAVRKTYEQGRRSLNHLGNCKYRGENGLCCVVGHMIDDEFYYKFFDQSAGVNANHSAVITAIERTAGLPLNSITNDECDFLCLLQKCHDGAGEGGTTFQERFKASIHSLAITQKQPWLMNAFETTQ